MALLPFSAVSLERTHTGYGHKIPAFLRSVICSSSYGKGRQCDTEKLLQAKRIDRILTLIQDTAFATLVDSGLKACKDSYFERN